VAEANRLNRRPAAVSKMARRKFPGRLENNYAIEGALICFVKQPDVSCKNGSLTIWFVSTGNERESKSSRERE
jgi:hypothetical protein